MLLLPGLGLEGEAGGLEAGDESSPRGDGGCCSPSLPHDCPRPPSPRPVGGDCGEAALAPVIPRPGPGSFRTSTVAVTRLTSPWDPASISRLSPSRSMSEYSCVELRSEMVSIRITSIASVVVTIFLSKKLSINTAVLKTEG